MMKKYNAFPPCFTDLGETLELRSLQPREHAATLAAHDIVGQDCGVEEVNRVEDLAGTSLAQKHATALQLDLPLEYESEQAVVVLAARESIERVLPSHFSLSLPPCHHKRPLLCDVSSRSEDDTRGSALELSQIVILAISYIV